MAAREDLSLTIYVFRIPELTRVICKWVGRRDQTALIRVCHQFYSSVMPLIWETTGSLSALFDLIPEIENTPGSSEIMRLPDIPDLTRFNVYAPHVRSLMMAAIHINKYENWDGFYSISRSTALLPHLSTIILIMNRPPDWRFITRTTMFLSPSLKNVWNANHRSFGGWLGQYNKLDLKQVSELLYSAASTCPRLKSLQIYPSLPPDNKRPDLRHSFFANFCCSIRSFDCLRELSTNTLILEHQSFLALGKLPALETLTIYPCAYNETISGPTLPEDAFTALRRLNLQMMNSDSMVQLCALRPLVRRLKTLHVFPQPNDIYSGTPILRLANPISALAKNNSTLSSLLIGDRSHYATTTVEVDSALLQQFRHFPLKRFTLAEHIFLPGATLQNLFEVLPTVEELSLALDDSLTLEQLRTFASRTKLPDLRDLDISIRFESARDLGEADFEAPLNQSLMPMRLQSGFNQIPKAQDLAKPAARFLRALWPNVMCVRTSELSAGYFRDGVKGARLINAELAVLRQNAAPLRDA